MQNVHTMTWSMGKTIPANCLNGIRYASIRRKAASLRSNRLSVFSFSAQNSPWLLRSFSKLFFYFIHPFCGWVNTVCVCVCVCVCAHVFVIIMESGRHAQINFWNMTTFGIQCLLMQLADFSSILTNINTNNRQHPPIHFDTFSDINTKNRKHTFNHPHILVNTHPNLNTKNRKHTCTHTLLIRHANTPILTQVQTQIY